MNRTLIVACAMAIAAAVPAHADNEQGFYAGAGVGEYNVKVDDIGDIGPVVGDFDSDDTSYKIFGGYRLNPYFALELAYINLGEPEDNVAGFPIHTKTDGFAPYAVGTLPLGIFEVFAKLGYLFYDVEVDLDDVRVRDSGEDLVYGAGVGVNLFEHLNVRLEYEEIDIENTDDSNALWLTAGWRF
jgi:OmpA-OmpF porin, OOP family